MKKIKRDVITEVDKTITKLCINIQNDGVVPEYYARTVEALALLVQARAQMQ